MNLVRISTAPLAVILCSALQSTAPAYAQATAPAQVSPTAPSANATVQRSYGPPDVHRPVVAKEDVEGQPVAPPDVPAALHKAAGDAAFGHPAVKAAEAQIRAAGYDLRSARWLRFPSLTVEALATSRGSAVAAQDGTVLNAVIEQPIWTGGRISAAIDRAKAQGTMRRAMLDETVRDLSLRTVQAYFDLANAIQRADVLSDVLGQHGELIATITRRVDQQISPQSDLELAKARSAQIEQQLTLAQAQRRSSLNTLIELTGDSNPQLGIVPAYNPSLHHPLLEGAVERALSCDPRTIRLRAEALIARAEQKSAKAALFPQLVGQLSSNEILGERVGVALRAQTGNGLSQAATAQGAGQRVSASEEAAMTAQRDVREALRLDFVNNAAAKQRIASTGNAAASSRLVTESYKRQFIAGRRTWLDVMNSLQETSSTRLGLVESEVLAMLTSARIALRTCAWEPRGRLEYMTETADVRR